MDDSNFVGYDHIDIDSINIQSTSDPSVYSSEVSSDYLRSSSDSVDYSEYLSNIQDSLTGLVDTLTISDNPVDNATLHQDLQSILLVLVVFLGITVFRGFHSIIKSL